MTDQRVGGIDQCRRTSGESRQSLPLLFARCPRSTRPRTAGQRFLGPGAKWLTLLLASLALGGTPALIAGDSSFVVNSTADDGSPGTLRWAIEQANEPGSGTQIEIGFDLPPGSTISLTSALPVFDNPAATILIDGPGAGALTIDGNNSHRVFFVASGDVSINEVTIANGAAQGGTGGTGWSGGGGGLGAGGALFVNSGASVSIQNVQFANNQAIGGTGGAITNNFPGGGGGAGFGGAGGASINGGGGGGGFAGAGANGSFGGGGGGGGQYGAGGEGSTGGGGGGGATAGGAANGGQGGSGNAGATGGSAGNDANGFGSATSGFSGQSTAVQGAGGGGAGGNSYAGMSPAGNGGAGGNGGIGGGGGGGGGGGFAGSFNQFGGGGQGGNGGVYGGGGGGGLGRFGSSGGAGGDFGGGGGAGRDLDSTHATDGGNGGFGGGGGGAADSVDGNVAGTGGFGAGDGGARDGSGSGGAGSGGSGYGGAVFVREGGSLMVVGATISNSSVTAGAAGGSGGSSGSAAGQDLYLMSGVMAIFDGAGSSINGSISGSGSVTIQGQGTTQFLGTNSYTGETIVKDTSRLLGNTNSLIGGISNHANVTFDQATDGTFAGSIVGTGSVTKSGTGSVSFTGWNAYDGGTQIEAGRLAVDGFLNGNVTVGTGAILGGSGVIEGNITNQGTVAAGNSIGTLSFLSDYSDIANSVMEVEIDADGTTPGVNNDLTVVYGKATLSGGKVNVSAAPGTYTVGSKYTFLQATSLKGKFSGITGFSEPGLRAVLGYGEELIGSTQFMTAYFLLMSGQSDFAAIAETFNQRGVAKYIDANSSDPSPEMTDLIDTLDSLSVDEQQAALEAMTAEVNGTLAQLQVQDTAFLYMMLRRRAGSAFAAGGLANGGTSGGFAMNGTAKQINLLPVSMSQGRSFEDYIITCDASTPSPRWGGWMVGYGLGGAATSDGNAAGGAYGSGGSIVAIERPLDREHLVGFFGAYSHLGLRLNGLSQRATADQGLFGAYFLRDVGSAYFLAAGSAGFTGYTETRQIAFGDINSTARGDYSGWNPSAYLESGLRWQLGRTTVQPYGALQYIYVRQNSFTETGADLLDLNVAGTDTNALRGLLGMRAAQAWATRGGQLLVPELRAAWMHEFLEPSTTLNAVFAPIGGASFAARGLDFGRDWAILGAGTQYVFNRHVSLFANYDLLFNGQQAWNAGSGGLQYVW